MEEVKREEIFVPPKCSEIFDMAWTCMKPSSQFNQIYRKGELENCPAIFGDWEKCIYASLSSDESKKQKAVETYTLIRPAPVNTVWELKDTPSWK